jgi:hypothetical protein
VNLTELARGRECQIRVPNQCLRSTETVVFCHYRVIDISGAGLKSPDWLGAFGCFRCHQIVDGQVNSTFTDGERRLMLAEGMARTLLILINEGVIYVPEVEARRPKLAKILPRRV